jgi:hypothetical protein
VKAIREAIEGVQQERIRKVKTRRKWESEAFFHAGETSFSE